MSQPPATVHLSGTKNRAFPRANFEASVMMDCLLTVLENATFRRIAAALGFVVSLIVSDESSFGVRNESREGLEVVQNWDVIAPDARSDYSCLRTVTDSNE